MAIEKIVVESREVEGNCPDCLSITPGGATEDESEMWWKNENHDEDLRALKPDEMNNAVLYGKVLNLALPSAQTWY